MDKQSIYCYPGTDVLINLANIRNRDELVRFETIVSQERLNELMAKPVTGRFDLEHLRAIHRYIFQDVYPFAGEIRRENIAKDDFRFAPAQFIEPYARELFRQLKDENLLKGLPVHEFADRAAHYMAEINVLHPFREGNGRTQREFIRQLAQNAGYQLEWSRADKSRVLQASIRSKVDTKELSDVILECIHQDGSQKLLLKDLLKQIEGMPSLHNAYLPGSDLNREVLKYRVRNMGQYSILDFQLKGDPELRSLRIDPVQVSRETKDLWIEQAAKNIRSISLDKGLEL